MTSFDKIFSIMTRPWAIFCYFGFVILSYCYLDQPVAYYFYHLDLKIKTSFLLWIIKVGVAPLYLVGFFLLALFCRYIKRNEAWAGRFWFLWLCVLIPTFICLVLKIILGRARPELLFDSHLFGFYGFHLNSLFWSFPSGHTSTLMGLVLGLGILFPRHCYTLFFIGLALASLRVLLTDHYMSDVLASSYLALIEIGIFLFVLKRKAWLIKRIDVASNQALFDLD
ncbi:phosphatase PAP2 family protein [bacterium]|nr:phosphatase PAP2 family protein [bacterium]